MILKYESVECQTRSSVKEGHFFELATFQSANCHAGLDLGLDPHPTQRDSPEASLYPTAEGRIVAEERRDLMKNNPSELV